MKVSIQLMKLLSDDTLWSLKPEQLVEKIGRQLGEVKEVFDWRGKYEGVKIAEITEVSPHPDADKLNVYQVNAGGNQRVQVVSGDTNLVVGDKVGWIAPGAVVPISWGTEKPFTLEVRPLRGQMSHGMFGSGKELDINDDDAKVIKLDTDAPAGTSFAEAYNLDDVVIDIENKMFTHRPDCFGNLGVAREIAGIQDKQFVSPDWYDLEANVDKPAHKLVDIAVDNQITDQVKRYAAVALDVEIKPSPIWLQSYLRRLGIRPINNVVDITNYVMVATGQPLHAFDFDKISGGSDSAKLVVRLPKKGESLTLLDGKKIELKFNEMLICDEHQPVALGGVMGGANSEISSLTKRIILESASFDMYQIRRTSMRHGIFTDAVTRFSKGQSPQQCSVVLAKAVEILKQFANAKVISDVTDVYPKKQLNKPIAITVEFINSRLGSSFTSAQVATTLRNVEMTVEQKGDELLVTAPFWRRDINIKEDVVEEVGRLIGYDKIPQNLPVRASAPANIASLDLLKSKIRSVLASAGANELQTYSFVPEKLLEDVGQQKTHAFKLRNALSPELQHYRLSLTPSLLEKVHPNIKAGHSEFALFEMNRVHIKGDKDCDELPREYQTLALVYAAKNPSQGASFYYAKRYLSYLLSTLNVDYEVVPASSQPQWEIGRQVFAPFEPKRSGFVLVAGEFAGFIGEYKFSTSKNLKLPKAAAGFELDIERLLKHKKLTSYNRLSKFPSVDQDICFKVKTSVNYGDLKKGFEAALNSQNREIQVQVGHLDIFQREDDAGHKQITFRVTLQPSDKTLSSDDANEFVRIATEKVHSDLGAIRV